GPVNPVVGRPEPIAGGSRERLVDCPYFALERLRLDGSAEVAVGCPRRQRFTIVIALHGRAEVRPGRDDAIAPLDPGHTLLLPAALGACARARAADGHEGDAVVLPCPVP